jgi:predicted amidophosphoribosyltransferase
VLLDLLLPRRCVVCARPGAQLCAACAGALPRLTPPLCALCGAPVAWPVARCRECSGRRLAFAQARAAVPYDAEVRRLVRRWKEGGLRRLADDLAAVVAARVPAPAAEAVTFVPPDPWRARRRGHHPAERLALALADRWRLPCVAALRRVDGGRRQRGLGAAERRRNPRFEPLGRAGSFVLVDDVYTTGATAAAVTRALKRAGAAGVDVLTFARVLPGDFSADEAEPI